MNIKTIPMTPDLYRYILDTAGNESGLLRRLREETAQLPDHELQISPDQSNVLGFFARVIDARRCLEVGVFTGYSSISVMAGLAPDARLVACDVNVEWTNVAQRYWQEAGLAERVDLRIGPAVDTLDGLIGERRVFDFAFIDANKEAYPRYYEQALQLVRPGGVIVFDNMLRAGHVADPSHDDEGVRAIRWVNATAAKDPRADAMLLAVSDGMLVVRRAQ